MRRISLWLLSTLSVVVLLFGYDGSRSATVPATPPAAEAAPSASNGSTGRTVTGDAAPTQWGPVQVQLTVSDGRITAVTVLQSPSGNPRDIQINDQALPILVDETTSAQSADIDVVSGATVTSDGYISSLQSAIDQADL